MKLEEYFPHRSFRLAWPEAEGLPLPTVGRDSEMDKISGLVRLMAVAGRGGSVAVTGGPGIGKTRLLEEINRRTQTCCTVLWYRGAPSETTMPFAGLHQILHPLRHHLKHLPEAHVATLEGVFGLSAPPKDTLSLSCATLALLMLAAEEAPLLLLVDDIQQLDETSLDVLAFVVRRLHNSPIFMLIAAREHESAYKRIQDLPEIRLGPLSPSETVLLAREILSDAAESAIDQISRESGGNPLIAIETATSLAFAASRGKELSDELLCSLRLKNTFGQLISDLPAPTRWMLLIAAANDGGDLHTTSSAAATLGLDSADFTPAEQSMIIAMAGDKLVFHPPFLRTIVYQNATFDERKTAHRALATATVTCPHRHARHLAAATSEPDEEVAQRIAVGAGHARQVSGMISTLHALEHAARLSQTPVTRSRFLLDAASCAWQAGRPLHAESLKRQVVCADDPHLLASAGLLQGAIAYTGVSAEVARTVLTDSAPHAALINPAAAVQLLLLTVRVELSTGESRSLESISRRLLDLSLGPDHPATLFGGALKRLADRDLRQSGNVDASVVGMLRSLSNGEPTVWPAVLPCLPSMGSTACEAFRRAVEDFRSQGAVGVLPLAAVSLITLEHCLGRWNDAEALGDETLLLAERLGQRTVAAEVKALLALIAAARGQSERCRNLAEGALECSSPMQSHLANAIAHWALGRASMSAGDPYSAIPHYSRVISPKDDAYHYVISLPASADLVECYMMIGREKDARKVLKTADQWKVDGSTPHLSGPVLRARAALAPEVGERERLLGEAIRLSRGSPFEQGRAELQLGKLLRREKRIQSARGHLQAAASVFTSLRAEPWLDQADAELCSTGHSRSANTGDVTGRLCALTPQELRIARLASQGLTNPEIALRLSISSNTIRYHLSKVFQKLNIASRRQLLQLNMSSGR